jgi:hypothetical protein
MPRNLILLAAAVLIAAFGAAGAAMAAGRSPSSDNQPLQFTIEFSDFSLLDLGEPGMSKGDQLIQDDRLLNASGSEVGHDGVACTVTDPSLPEAACQGSFSLALGQITVQFLNGPPAVKIGAVTGGTGRYRNARGQVKIVEPDTGNHGSITFTLSED